MIENYDDCNGISGCLLKKLKITTAFNPSTPDGIANAVNGDGIQSLSKNLQGEVLNSGSGITADGFDGVGGFFKVYTDSLIASILGSIFIIIASFVLFALAIMLLIRFIMLLILLITSPVMFLGWVLPNLSSISKEWLKS